MINCFKKNTLISPPFRSEVEVRVSSDVRRQSQVTFKPPCGSGNGSPLQYSRLENPKDRGA